MNMVNKSLRKTTQLERACQLLVKLVIDPNPVALIVNSFFDSLNTFQMNNIIDFVNDLHERVNRLEEGSTIKFQIDEFTFKEEVLPILQKVKDEIKTNKRKLYATFLAASIHPCSLNCSNKQIYLNYIEQLDYLSIYILNHAEHECHEKKIAEKIGNKFSEEDIIVHLSQLYSLGLLDKISAVEYEKVIRGSEISNFDILKEFPYIKGILLEIIFSILLPKVYHRLNKYEEV